jgi:hypothetical protein
MLDDGQFIESADVCHSFDGWIEVLTVRLSEGRARYPYRADSVESLTLYALAKE